MALMYTVRPFISPQTVQPFKVTHSSISSTDNPTPSPRNPVLAIPTPTSALPQSKELNPKFFQRTTILTTATVLSILSRSLASNLWLLGMFSGACYGQFCSAKFISSLPPSTTAKYQKQISKQLVQSDSRNLFDSALLKLSFKVSCLFAHFCDAFTMLKFMYKTGQLSLDYYKKYEVLDQKYKLSDKMEVWNSRFVSGKKKFDKFEAENEIGRRMIASARTFILVTESGKKERTLSKTSITFTIELADLTRRATSGILALLVVTLLQACPSCGKIFFLLAFFSPNTVNQIITNTSIEPKTRNLFSPLLRKMTGKKRPKKNINSSFFLNPYSPLLFRD